MAKRSPGPLLPGSRVLPRRVLPRRDLPRRDLPSRVGLVGIGTAAPGNALSQARALEMAAGYSGIDRSKMRVLEQLYRKTQIQNRSTVLEMSGGSSAEEFYRLPSAWPDTGPSTAERMQRYQAEVAPLAFAAADQALCHAGLAPGSIGQLVTVSCTGFRAPGFDVGLVRDLNLSATVGRSHLGFMGCHGALNALRVGASLCRSLGENVLICAAELCSLHFQYGSDHGNLVANALFSDGAAAMVLSKDCEQPVWRHIGSASMIVPDSLEAITWTIGDSGFLMTLSSELPALIEKYLPDWLNQWLSSFGIGLADVKLWAVHPGGPRILDAVEQCLGLNYADLADCRAVLADLGNMSSPTILFILDRLGRRLVTGPCVALGFGPGLTIEAALLQRDLLAT